MVRVMVRAVSSTAQTGNSISLMGDRVVVAKAEALSRHYRQRRQLAPFRLAVIAAVLVVALTSKPPANFDGRGLAITLCLVVFCVGVMLFPASGSANTVTVSRTLELVAISAVSVALVFLQPRGLAELPASAAVFIAGVSLFSSLALALGLTVTAGVGVALGPVDGAGVGTVISALLLCAVLGVTGALLRRSRLSQDRTELLLAELEEARDDQARAAAMAERASIAGELHDVLAHSLSGLAIQLEGARKQALSEGATNELRATIDSAAALAKEGLVEARNAVGALRREEPMNLERLPDLIKRFQKDFDLPVDFVTIGATRLVSPEVGLALYRVAGEALTNVNRHAKGATTHVTVTWRAHEVGLTVIDEGGERGLGSADGSGWGLIGMRERVSRLGGRLVAEPSGSGWLVDAMVPG
jgi:signal transduction histidine kinase